MPFFASAQMIKYDVYELSHNSCDKARTMKFMTNHSIEIIPIFAYNTTIPSNQRIHKVTTKIQGC